MENEDKKNETGPHIGELKKPTVPTLLSKAQWKLQLE